MFTFLKGITAKKKIAVILSYLILLLGNKASGQNGYGFPSAENSFLGNVGGSSQNIDVDRYTGKLMVTIPLTQVIGKTTSVPVALSYIAGGGVRNQDYSSCVGTGWQLFSGGSISRVVRAIPDEHPTGYIGTGQHGKAIKSAIDNNTTLHLNYYNYIDNDFRYKSQVYDSEPDIFFVSTPTFSFQFTFDENGVPITSNQSGVKISFEKSGNYNDSYFIVKDDMGNSYYFGFSGSRTQVSEELCGENRTYNSVWHLEKITNAANTDVINFTYSKFGGANGLELNSEYTTELTRLVGGTLENTQFKEHQRSIKPLYINSIKSKYGEVYFAYSTDRRDIAGTAPRLTSITTYQNTTAGRKQKQQLDFSTSYFGGQSIPHTGTKYPDLYKLRLDSIGVRLGENPDVRHRYKVFEYFRTDAVYSRRSSSTDYFGFRTSFSAGDPMKDPTLRQPHSLLFSGIYALTKIIDRSGASNTVSFDLNTYFNSQSEPNKILGGLRVSRITSTQSDGTSLVRRFLYEFNGVSSGSVYGPDYAKLSIVATNTIQRIERIYSSSIANSSDINGNFIGYDRVREIFSNNSYSDTYFQNYSHYPDKVTSLQNSPTVNLGGVLTGSTISYAHKRGMPIKTLSFDVNNRPTEAVNYYYKALNTNEIKTSYAVNSRVMGAQIGNYGGTWPYSAIYYSVIENYRLDSVLTKQFIGSTNDTTQAFSQDIKYEYHPNRYYLRSSKSTDSNRNIFKKTFYYPEDDGAIPLITIAERHPLSLLVSANMKGIIVHETDALSTNEELHMHNVFGTAFNVLSTSKYRKILPANTFEKLSDSEFYFDASTNRMKSSRRSDKIFESTDYNDLDQIVVTVENAKSVYDANISSRPNKHFEFYYEGFEKNYHTNNYAGDGSTTSPYIVPFVIGNTRRYMIDYRYYDTSSRKWMFAKKRYSNGMVLSEGSRIDEVRIYPEDAMMSTKTHGSAGTTSETDWQGNTIFYEYDNYDRLVTILDQEKNVIKTYCYNFKGEHTDCFAFVEEPGSGIEEGTATIYDEYWHGNVITFEKSDLTFIIKSLSATLKSNTGVSWYNDVLLAVIDVNTHRPTRMLSQTGSYNGSQYLISVLTNGEIKIRHIGGSAPVAGTRIVLSDIVFP